MWIFSGGLWLLCSGPVRGGGGKRGYLPRAPRYNRGPGGPI